MSLNNIELTPSLAATLYRFALIESDKSDSSVQQSLKELSASDTWKSLGDNKKNILIVVNHKNMTHLPDEELTFLTSMLTACKLNLGDVAIVNTNNSPHLNYKDYLTHYNSKIILLFAVDPISFGLPVDFPAFQVQSLANATFLYSPALDERHQDTLFKSKLWVCLRRIFGV